MFSYFPPKSHQKHKHILLAHFKQNGILDWAMHVLKRTRGKEKLGLWFTIKSPFTDAKIL